MAHTEALTLHIDTELRAQASELFQALGLSNSGEESCSEADSDGIAQRSFLKGLQKDTADAFLPCLFMRSF